MKRAVDVLVAGATGPELEALRARLGPAEVLVTGVRPLLVGQAGGLRVGLLATGVGKANAAMALAAAFQAVDAGLLVVTGVGGAYPASGLVPGDLAVATEEAYGDEGAESAQGFLGLEELGFPLWEEGGRRFFNRFPAASAATEVLAEAGEAVARIGRGLFVTVSTVTGTARRARELESLWGGVCESMEGAAAAHAAAVRGVPFAEVRGIANPVGPRDRAAWKLTEAADAAQAAVWGFLDEWGG